MTGGDMRMKIGFSSHPGQSDFTQWLDAMKMVARLQDGIPTDFRKKLWLTLAERHLEQRGVNWKQAERICFDEWCNPDDEELGIQIVKDLHRTGCSLFCGAAGRDNQAVLRRVLLGFARWNKSVGYCQGLNVLAALVLQVVDREEASAVKVMIFLVEGVLPEGYFADNLRGLSVDMAVFRDLLRTRLPKLSRHLEALQSDAKDKTTGSSYEPPLTNVFTMQWFLTLFCHCLPQEAVLRIWDLIFLDGDEILLRTALAIWEGLSERIMGVTSADEFYSIMGVLTKEMLEFTDTNNLIKAIVSMGTLHGVTSLREKHRYNITPWTRKLSDDEDTDTDDDDRLAVAAAVFDRMPTSLGILQSAGHDRERLTLDITSLKQQYAKLRERQRQAHIILSAACARQSMVPTSQSPAMNHLLVGKSALVSNKGRQLTPSSVTTPLRAKLSGLLSPVAAQSRKAESRHQQSVTLHWKDTKKVKDHPGAAATATTTTTTTTTVNTTNFNTTTATATATAGVADAVAAVSAADADASVDPITADPAASTTISTANATIDDKKETLSGRSSAKLTVSPGRSTPSRRESLGSDSDSTSTELCDEFDYQSEDDSLEVLGDDVQQEHTTFPRPSSSRKKGEEEEEVENDLEVEKQPRWKGISDCVQDISSTVTSPPGEDPPAFPVYEVQLNHRDPVSTYTFPEDLEPLEPLKPPKAPEVGLNFFQEKTLEVKSPEESCSSGETMGPDSSPRTADFPRYSSSSDSRTLVIREQSDSDASKDTEIRGGSSESYSPGRYNKSSEKSFSSDLLSPVSANSLKYTSVRGTLDLTSAISPFYPIQNSNNEKTPSPRLASGPEERKESSSGKVLGEDSEKKEESWSEESLDYLGDVKYRIRRDSCKKGPYERSYSSLATPMSSEPGDEEMTTAKKRSSDILQDLRHLEARTGEETAQKESLMSKSALSSWEDLKNLEARRRDTFSNSASGFSKYRLAVPGLGLLGKTYHVEPKMSIDEGSDSILKSIATNQGCELEDSKLGVWTKVKPRNRESSGRRSSSDRALKIIQENSAILHKIFACQAKKRLPDLEEISKEITISPINEEISKIFSPILERMGLNEHEINEELARINFKDLDVGNTVPTSVSEFDSKINDELSRLSLIDDPEEEIRNFDDETTRDELIDRKINEELSRLLSDYPDREVTRQLFSPTSNPSRHRLESASSTSSSRFRGLSPRSDIDIYQELEKLDKISSAQSFPVARLDLENQRIPELGLTRVPEVPRISPELLVPRRASRRSELSPDLGIPRLGVLEEKDSSPEVGLPRVRGYRDLQERLSPELTLPISSRTTLQRDLPEMRSFLHSTPYDSGTRSFQFDKSPESKRPALSKEHLEFRVRYDVKERTQQQQQQQQQQSSYLTKTSPGDGYPRKDYFRADEKPDSFEFLARSPDFGSYKLPGVKSTGGGGSYGESVKSGFEDTEDTVERYQRYQKSLNLYPGTETPEVGVCSRGFGRSEEETTDGEAKTQFSPFPIRNLIRKPKELGLKLGLYSSSSTTSSSGPLKKS